MLNIFYVEREWKNLRRFTVKYKQVGTKDKEVYQMAAILNSRASTNKYEYVSILRFHILYDMAIPYQLI